MIHEIGTLVLYPHVVEKIAHTASVDNDSIQSSDLITSNPSCLIAARLVFNDRMVTLSFLLYLGIISEVRRYEWKVFGSGSHCGVLKSQLELPNIAVDLVSTRDISTSTTVTQYRLFNYEL